MEKGELTLILERKHVVEIILIYGSFTNTIILTMLLGWSFILSIYTFWTIFIYVIKDVITSLMTLELYFKFY